MGQIRQTGPRGTVVSLVLALMLTVAAFPEVFLAHGSLTGAGLLPVVDAAHMPRSTQVLPNVTTRSVGSGSFDLGARGWQFEPGTNYMHEVLLHGRDPSWNPWQGSGELGPETLDGMEESPFVLAVAGLGASELAFTAVALVFVVAALYCLQQFFVRTLGMSRIAGVGACLVFLLNGWMTATFASVTSVPYLMFPVLLYVVTEYQRAPKPWRFAVAAATYTGLWVTTFPPGQFADMVMVTAVAFVLDVTRRWNDELTRSTASRVVAAVGRQVILPLVGFLGAAFVMVPAVSAFMRSGDSMAAYSHSHLNTRRPLEWLGLLTPRHVFTTYNPASFPRGINNKNLTVYLGIAPLMLTAAAWSRTRGVTRWLLSTLMVIGVLAVTQMMGLPGLKAIGDLPGLRTISANYWGGLAATAFTVAFGLAAETARRNGLSLRVALGSAAVIVVALLGASRVTTVAASTRAGPHASVSVHLAIVGLTAVVVVGLVWYGSRAHAGGLLFACLAVGLVATELYSYQNHVRPRRSDVLSPTPAYLAFLYDHLGNQRTLNAGHYGLAPNWGEVTGIHEVESLDVMQIPWYRHFFQTYIDPESLGQRFLLTGEYRAKTFSADPAALDLLSVKYLVVDAVGSRYALTVSAAGYPPVMLDRSAKVAVFENPSAFPRAFVSPALTTGQRLNGPLHWSQSTTVTEDRQLLAAAVRDHIPTSAGGASRGSATITRDESTEVRVKVHAVRPSLVVLTDTYYPNWTATVNGRPAHVGKVDSVVRGVIVPSGASTIVFRYHSSSRDWGELVSVTTAVALLAGSGAWAWRRRRRRLDR